jgi:hypothetical protein
LATWNEEEETKRDFIYRMFPALERSEKGPGLLRHMARELSEQVSYPDLEGWEDSADKKGRASKSVAALRAYLAKQKEEAEDQRAQAEARKRAQVLREELARKRADLDKLRIRLDNLATTLGSAEAGYAFQEWFYDLAAYFEILARRPYTIGGRQIDGSITVDGTTYLVELKFTAQQAGAPDIDIFYKKVVDKADNTMGIMVSISGYSSVAVDGASVPKTPLLLLDHAHLYSVLSGTVTLKELVNRVRRHSSQTSRAYLPAAEM